MRILSFRCLCLLLLVVAAFDFRGHAAEPPAAVVDPAIVKTLAGQLLAAPSDADRDALLAAAPAVLANSQDLRRAFHKALGAVIFGGDFARAEALVAYDRQLAERYGDTIGAALAQWSLATIEADRGENVQALARFEQCRAVFEASGDKVRLAGVTSCIGMTEMQMDDFRLALKDVRRAHELYVELKDKEGITNALNTLGNIDMEQGLAERALDYYQQALALAGDDEDWQVYLFHNLASVHEARGDMQQAASYMERSAALSEKQGLKPILAQCFDVLGSYRLRAGQIDEADKSYRRALEIAESIGDKRRLTSVLRGLAHVGNQRGGEALGPALARAERAVTLARETGEPTRVWQANTTAGKLHHALGDLPRARAAFEAAIAAIEDTRDHLSGGDAEAMAFFEDKVDPYQQMVALLVEQKEPLAALAMAERAKARVLIEILRSPKLDPAKQMTVAERANAKRLADDVASANRDAAAAGSAQPPPAARLAELAANLQRARLARDTAESDFLLAHPELRSRRPPLGEALSPEILHSVLGNERTALLEYVVTDDRTFLFVVKKAAADGQPDVRVFNLSPGRETLAKRTAAFRQALATRNLGWETDARALGADLLEPARSAWADAEKLVIIPDGPLWELPFQALAANPAATGPLTTLWESQPLSFAPSLTFLAQAGGLSATQPALTAPRLLALGNPFVGNSPSGAGPAKSETLMDDEFLPLPDAERQVGALVQLYGAEHSRAFVGAAAHEDAFKQVAADYDVIHFATHGFFNNTAPMYSRLLLCQHDLAAGEDGLLEAWEWLPLRLHARLVVLSACETGRGRIGAGEGMLGMSWALFSAGCPAAVVSQWKVDSGSTTELMVGFHRRLLAGKDPAEALREAGLELAKNPRYDHPFYWAPFVLVGADRPLAGPGVQ